MSRNVCGPLADKGGFGFVPPAKSGPIASAARRTESRVGRGPPGTACHCTLREAHRAFGIGHSVRRKPSEGRAISPCSSGSLPRKGRTQRGTTNHRRVGMGRTAWLKALYYDIQGNVGRIFIDRSGSRSMIDRACAAVMSTRTISGLPPSQGAPSVTPL